MARPRTDIRPRVIESARARFLAEGVDGASLRGIAQDAGTSVGMIYYYFKTKDDLFLGVVEDVYAGFLEDFSVAFGQDVPVEERIRRAYARAARMSEKEFMVVRIVIREALISSSRLERLIQRFAEGHLPLLVRTLTDGRADGTIEDRHPLPIQAAMVGAVGIFPQILRRIVSQSAPALGALLPDPEALASMLAEMLLTGIGGTKSKEDAQS